MLIRIDENLKKALADAAEQEFCDIPAEEDLDDTYVFSDQFQRGMSGVFRLAERSYVSVGRHRLRQLVAVALIGAVLMVAAAGAVAMRRPVVRWFTQQNEKDGALDVSFDVDDPDGLTKQFTYIRPDVPQGYKITYEEKTEDFQYFIEYENEDGSVISYIQSGDIESMGLGLDNETGDLREVKVNGHKGYAYSGKDNNTLIWSNGIYLFNLGGNCPMEVIEEIAGKIN